MDEGSTKKKTSDDEGSEQFAPRSVSPEAIKGIEEIGEDVGGPYKPYPEAEGAVAFTHFDSASTGNRPMRISIPYKVIFIQES